MFRFLHIQALVAALLKYYYYCAVKCWRALFHTRHACRQNRKTSFFAQIPNWMKNCLILFIIVLRFFPFVCCVLCSVAFGLNCICSQNCNIQSKQQATKCICSMKYTHTQHTHNTVPNTFICSKSKCFFFHFILTFFFVFRSFVFIYLLVNFFVSVDSFKRMMVNHLFGWEKMQLSIKHIHRWNNTTNNNEQRKTHTQNLVCWIDYYDATRKYAAGERARGREIKQQ